jgi:sigma-B regulation protein RsbU (phosphoserine phosphatase)
MICVPLRIDRHVIGAIQVLNKTNGFSGEDAELLGLIAFYSASAIQSERLRQEAEAGMLLRHEVGLAAEVQRKLLPEGTVQQDGVELAALCRPAAFVGGDFYDLLPLPGGNLAITLGDVSGKGLPAAVMMASIQPLLRNLLLRDSNHLSHVVADLNDSIWSSSSAERYSTLFCGVLNREHTQLTYVNAGHVPPFIIRQAEGRIEHPMEGNVPVGLMPGTTFDEQKVSLRPGDVFLCISDGILEARNSSDELWDESEVTNTLGKAGGLSAQQILTKLVQAVDDYAQGSDQADDMTAVVLKTGSGSDLH